MARAATGRKPPGHPCISARIYHRGRTRLGGHVSAGVCTDRAAFWPGSASADVGELFAGFAAGQLAQGLLSDRFGRRGSLGAGLLLYSLASLGCAAAPNAAFFCVFRALAAFGAAASIVITRAMVRDLADGTRAASLMSDVLMVMSVAPVLAPVLGSLILMFTNWRMIFVVAALYGVAGLFLLVRYLSETLK